VGVLGRGGLAAGACNLTKQRIPGDQDHETAAASWR
jgi:hypothetical protein